MGCAAVLTMCLPTETMGVALDDILGDERASDSTHGSAGEGQQLVAVRGTSRLSREA